MKYELYKDTDFNLSPVQQILYNRGIEVKDQESWLQAWWGEINDYKLLKNCEEAADMIIKHCMPQSSGRITILQDCDCDGIASTAIIYNYIYRAFGISSKIIIHSGKQHGLNDVNLNEIITTTDLLILPDSSSNDYEQHKVLKEAGVDIVIADHHICEKYSEDAIVVNNQLDNYPNKDFSGAGVMWQICRCMDDKLNSFIHMELVDLCALGNLGDMMDYRNNEVRAIVSVGLSTVFNEFLRAIINKNDYSFSKMNGVNYYSMAFYCVPFLNAICRSGTDLEKRLVINAFLEDKYEEEVQSSKRGEKGKKTSVLLEALTTIERVKRRQNKAQDDAMEFFERQIAEKNLNNNAIIACVCDFNEIPPEILGLIANKIQAKYQHPTLVLREIGTEDGIHLSGSARNYSYCPIEDMRQVCEDTGLVDYAQGHSGAYGISIPLKNFREFIEVTNKVYEDIEFEPTYKVDYIWNENEIDAKTILGIAELNIYGQGIPESKIAIEDINLNGASVSLLSPDKHPTIKITLSNGVSLMKFKSSVEEYAEFSSGDKILCLVGKPSKNEWMGNVSAQIIIDDFELKDAEDVWIF